MRHELKSSDLTPSSWLLQVLDEVGIVAVVDVLKRERRLRVHVVGHQAQRVDPRLLRYLQAVVGSATEGEIGKTNKSLQS